ncbi:MAG: hypothetical protein HC915_16270 [Anaerolineae bacterium]|nr:hypothetical protein [Anaerolineae bacterium]
MTSTTTMVVVANLATGVICMALMLVVFWQAPRQRTNQLFSLMMLMLVGYTVANILGRFIEELALNGYVVVALSNTLLLYFIVLSFLFAEEFSTLRSRRFRWLGGALMIFVPAILALDLAFDGPFPAESDLGGYTINYQPLGALGIVLSLFYLARTTYRLSRATDPRARALYPATGAALAGVLLLSLRPLSTVMGEPFSTLLVLPYTQPGWPSPG